MKIAIVVFVVLGLAAASEYKPQYKYRAKQCWPSLGFCWCVDEAGNEVPGSKFEGDGQCPNYEGKTMCQLQALAAKPHNVGSYISKCQDNGDYEPKQCARGYCWCVGKDGKPLDKTRTRKTTLTCPDFAGKTKCQLMAEVAKTVWRTGDVIKCKEDGTFEEMQCSATTRSCWCVDKEGGEIQGSKTTNVHGLQCTSHAELGKTDCQKKQVQNFDRYGPNMPQCKEDGAYEEKQCMTNGYCVCVDKYGKPIAGTGKFGDITCAAH